MRLPVDRQIDWEQLNMSYCMDCDRPVSNTEF